MFRIPLHLPGLQAAVLLLLLLLLLHFMMWFGNFCVPCMWTQSKSLQTGAPALACGQTAAHASNYCDLQ